MNSGKSWSKKNFVSKCKDKEYVLFWSHHETQLFIKGYHPRNLIRTEEKRKPKTTWLGNIIQWTDMDLERILNS